jgi:hypothetical protein
MLETDDREIRRFEVSKDQLLPLRPLVALTMLLVLAAVSVGAQGQATQGNKSGAATKWTPARTADGHPDLQGIWTNNTATPFERPKELAGREYLTDAEVATLQKIAGELFNGETDAAFGDAVFTAAWTAVQGKTADIKAANGFDTVTGNYNQFWLVDRSFDNRTSVVTTPDGRIPPLTPEAQKRMAEAAEYRKLHPADGPEDFPLGHRCVNFGVPKLGAGYNSYHQIFQTPTHVAMFSEMAHDTRIIPLDGRPHLDTRVRQWNGDSRGRWEGDTLVVETRNFSPKSEFRAARENLRLTERFTRVAPDTLEYDVTVDDPSTWTKPWGAKLLLKRSEEPIFEYACHEGNEGLPGALSGYRAQEKAEAAAKGSK